MPDLSRWLTNGAVKRIGKERFLEALAAKPEWQQLVRGAGDVDDTARQIMEKIKKSPGSWAFNRLSITEQDIKDLLNKLRQKEG